VWRWAWRWAKPLLEAAAREASRLLRVSETSLWRMARQYQLESLLWVAKGQRTN
jgi:hypothetical protein